MAYFNGPTYIDTPAQAELPLGIFDAALGPMPWPREESQGGGIIYVPDACEDDVFLVDMSCPPITGAKTFSPIEFPVSGAPFAVLTSYTCGSIGFSFAEVEQRLRTRMMLREQRAVEKRIWSGSTGVLGTIPSLFANATSLGSAGCPVEAVQMLEQTLADNAIVGGIIHARPAMTPHLANNHLLESESRRVRRTPLGTRYAFGQGYAGTGPSGGAISSTSEWMYASGRVSIWAGDVEIPPIGQTLNKTNNQIMAIAEKTFAVAIECGVWAVQVNHTCTTAGST